MLKATDLRALPIEQTFSEQEDRHLVKSTRNGIALGTYRRKSSGVKNIGTGYEQPYMEKDRQDHSSIGL